MDPGLQIRRVQDDFVGQGGKSSFRPSRSIALISSATPRNSCFTIGSVIFASGLFGRFPS
jgi:hypothetical protein